MLKISHQPSKHDKAFFLSTIFKFVLVSIARSQHFYKSSLEKSQPSPREYCKIRAMLAMTEQPLEGTLLWELSGVMMKISSTQGQVLDSVQLHLTIVLRPSHMHSELCSVPRMLPCEECIWENNKYFPASWWAIKWKS